MKTKLLAAVSVAAIVAACGESPKSSSMRGVSVTSSSIVGGQVVSDFGYPYVVLILNESGYICTGTLIDDFVVLTAAHCVDDPNPANYEIVGADDPFGEGYYWLTGAASVHPHPEYDSQQLWNDVGIIVLDAEPAQEDPTGKTQPIAYVADDDGTIYDVGTDFTAVGFGVTNGSGADDSGVKRKVGLSITELDQYGDIFYYGSSNQNTCSGDSGGPALVMIDGAPAVIGVVSFGDQNCTQYGGDSRTDYFSPFIAQFAGAGATPTPGNTPTPGDDDDDDDDPKPGDDDDGNKADDPWSNVGCSLAGVTNVAGIPAGFLALLAVATIVRRRRE